jgi:tetratricopeptide (TPR) repeat protein
VNAHELLHAARASAARAGDAELEQLVEGLRAEAYLEEGRLEEAEALYEAIVSDTQARHLAAFQALASLPDIAFARRNFHDALDGFTSDVRFRQARGLESDIAWNLQSVGCCLIALGHPARGLTLIAAADMHSTRLGMEGRPRGLSEMVSEQMLLADRALGRPAAQRALEHGRQMGWDAAVGLALRATTIVRNTQPRAVA